MLESKSWLYKQMTVEELERIFAAQNQQGLLTEWEQFKLKIAPGDELWTYSGGMGNVGVALLRQGEVIEDFEMMAR